MRSLVTLTSDAQLKARAVQRVIGSPESVGMYMLKEGRQQVFLPGWFPQKGKGNMSSSLMGEKERRVPGHISRKNPPWMLSLVRRQLGVLREHNLAASNRTSR